MATTSACEHAEEMGEMLELLQENEEINIATADAAPRGDLAFQDWELNQNSFRLGRTSTGRFESFLFIFYHRHPFASASPASGLA